MRQMHPLWEQYQLSQGENDSEAPSYFYFNPYNGKNGHALVICYDTKQWDMIGKLTLEFPEIDSHERGGILADGK